MNVKTIDKMTGYKATDKDMKCQDHQFKLGVWYEVDGDLSLCRHGFHFCDHPSGPWAYYGAPGTRIFTCEAEDVLDLPVAPGADAKRVARRVRLVAEVVIDGDRNTGNLNTGNLNTGDRNTGNLNTGDLNTGCGNTGYGNTGNWNTGDWNTGDRNTGDLNTGCGNTGDWNTGCGNTGNWNTGDWNTGDRNTGDLNTGDRNTGNLNTGDLNTGCGNTGYGNAGDRNAGVFCLGEPTICCFGEDTGLTFDKFFEAFPIAYQLGEALTKGQPIPFEPYEALPGITKAKLKALHDAHKAERGQ